MYREIPTQFHDRSNDAAAGPALNLRADQPDADEQREDHARPRAFLDALEVRHLFELAAELFSQLSTRKSSDQK